MNSILGWTIGSPNQKLPKWCNIQRRIDISGTRTQSSNSKIWFPGAILLFERDWIGFGLDVAFQRFIQIGTALTNFWQNQMGPKGNNFAMPLWISGLSGFDR